MFNLYIVFLHWRHVTLGFCCIFKALRQLLDALQLYQGWSLTRDAVFGAARWCRPACSVNDTQNLLDQLQDTEICVGCILCSFVNPPNGSRWFGTQWFDFLGNLLFVVQLGNSRITKPPICWLYLQLSRRFLPSRWRCRWATWRADSWELNANWERRIAVTDVDKTELSRFTMV